MASCWIENSNCVKCGKFSPPSGTEFGQNLSSRGGSRGLRHKVAEKGARQSRQGMSQIQVLGRGLILLVIFQMLLY